jgi:tetrahydromethanopterin S-methyltransferase subunit E
MALTTLTKTSGVLFVTVGTVGVALPKSYFGATGSYTPYDDSSGFQISIGADVYRTAWEDLRVGTSTPTSFSQARTLLNAIFGT